MKLITLLILTLSQQGFWIGGTEGTLAIRPAARGGLPAADVQWELMFNGVLLQHGVDPLPANDGELTIKLTPPQVRTRITLLWTYRLLARDTGRQLEQGQLPIQVFPEKLEQNLAAHVRGHELGIWDVPTGIPRLLDSLNVSFTLLGDFGPSRVWQGDLLLIGPDILQGSRLEQASLLEWVQRGKSVMIFRQTRTESVVGVKLARRAVPRRLEWKADHPLFDGLEPDDLQSWTHGATELWPLQLSGNDDGLVLSYYPPETSGPGISAGQRSSWAPSDGMLITRTIGKGRLVLCQLPLGDWMSDPRSQIFMRNAIEYLLTRPQAPRQHGHAAATAEAFAPRKHQIHLQSEGRP